ncbi:MAG: phosphoenolpyruvate--protein phosphotransferase, partial [Actinomycetes bacterium]|nr:phosphoenolpyruvate--protein phosphotransferase [Actinomycetes bacterium]MDX5380948.1 phosphoenolpyruvate--protein phosphotransferase [Actinomycetes bacterium]MDX5400060.1 phosphoenolpyruvate--protein phosphotransferase [Actinomycetes bacterium]MDX5450710.1 phosphoenolpyruvate--protein phosphotransferase [Actinomycetes bacterium]
VSTVDEARAFAALARERGISPGIMVEVPSVAILADAFVAEVDFFSIGTNDLTQYTLAADRMSSPLASLTDPWQPAVLRLIAMTAEAGGKAGKPVGVCGEAAADPLLACILIGLGVTSLSMATNAIPAVGVQLASVTLEQCRDAARHVLGAATALEAKELAAELL